MSHSFFNTDRSTHFKIVLVALTCSVAVILFCVLARTNNLLNETVAAPAVIKAKTGIVVTSDDATLVR